eukprot:1571596-Ditylum_brightwellii.AAC.1
MTQHKALWPLSQANVDTINAHDGCAGCHPKLLDEHVKGLMSERGLDTNSDTNELKKAILDAKCSA